MLRSQTSRPAAQTRSRQLLPALPYLPPSLAVAAAGLDSCVRAHRRTHHAMRGLTLIEVLIVVVILGILAGLVIVNVTGRTDDAKVAAAKHDISALMSALKLYRLDNGVYPGADQGLPALVRKPETGEPPRNWKTGGYIERLPKDPWGNDYQYLTPGVHSEVDVFSFGADGRPGGEGYDADIGSWGP